MPGSEPLTPHAALGGLTALLGTWEGEGAGDYPTIAPFRYREQVVFGHVGKPFLAYLQRTWALDQGTPMHTETGYLRAVDDDATPIHGRDPASAGQRVELVLAHPTGIVEVEEGALEGGVLTLRSRSIGLSSTAKDVRSLRREFRLDGDALTYDLWMAYADVPETHHLRATLYRTSGSDVVP